MEDLEKKLKNFEEKEAQERQDLMDAADGKAPKKTFDMNKIAERMRE
jgi:hypothetical protein